MTRPGTFEIRVICAPEQAERVTAALAGTFTTGPARAYPTRERTRVRLYLTATAPAPAPALPPVVSDR
ncbi:hypothetical protein [Streptomyces sp. L2]|uniref:hypothetical protein n=1 Tax=Streptomyces sp. L2 TaxID=2162665 RepID=UPI001010D4A0|nr:hypothetical protein [Streptomyces sp. L2]